MSCQLGSSGLQLLSWHATTYSTTSSQQLAHSTQTTAQDARLLNRSMLTITSPHLTSHTTHTTHSVPSTSHFPLPPLRSSPSPSSHPTDLNNHPQTLPLTRSTKRRRTYLLTPFTDHTSPSTYSINNGILFSMVMNI
jgi:hypothetical protein